MPKLFKILFLLIFTSCSSKEQKYQISNVKPERIVENQNVVSYNRAYYFRSDSLELELLINDSINGKIPFSLKVFEKRSGKIEAIKGIATAKSEIEDLEIDEDEDGEAYPAKEYLAEVNKSTVIIRVAYDPPHKFAKVNCVDCNGLLKNLSLDYLFTRTNNK